MKTPKFFKGVLAAILGDCADTTKTPNDKSAARTYESEPRETAIDERVTTNPYPGSLRGGGNGITTLRF